MKLHDPPLSAYVLGYCPNIQPSPDGFAYREPGIKHSSAPEVVSVIEDQFAIIKIKGAKGFVSRGKTRYYPTEYRLLRFDSETGQGIEWLATDEPGRQWRESISALARLAEETLASTTT